MAGISVPGDTKGVERSGLFTRVWLHFFGGVARKLNTASQVDTVTTADATDLATAEALANQLKTTVNELIAAMKA